ncbi:MAG TPA: hypothetical protein VE684_05210 [Crenalkalicoccus sp.]|nr:hypothetical protein [Crenalkalicoccus sp.]
MSDGAANPVLKAAERLEAAVEHLAAAIAARTAADADMIPRTEVSALAERLDATVARLRTALAEEMRRAEEE